MADAEIPPWQRMAGELDRAGFRVQIRPGTSGKTLVCRLSDRDGKLVKLSPQADEDERR